jgi:hypothetical protein
VVLAPPALTIDDINPKSGSNTGTFGPVTITGTGFVEKTSVVLRQGLQNQNDIVAKDVKVSDEGKKITCSFDLGSEPAGERNVVVINPDKSQAIKESIKFNVEESPSARSITKIDPTEGKGTIERTIIIGTGLTDATEVKFTAKATPSTVASNVQVSNMVVLSDSTISCDLNVTGDPGEYEVVVMFGNDELRNNVIFNVQS